MKTLICLTAIIALSFQSCSTDTGDLAKDARGRATNEALTQAATVLGKVAVSAIFTAGRAEMGGEKADYGNAVAEGIWTYAPTIISGDGIQRIIDAYSGKRLESTATVAAQAFNDAAASHSSVAKANAIAAVISTAAGAPPGP